MSKVSLDDGEGFDALVVGAGAAGLYAALCLPSGLRVGLISKDNLHIGASDWAQGGIAAAIAPSDTPVLHLDDTLKAGAGLCDRAAVQFLVENAGAAIESLLELGVAFDRKGEQLAMTLEAAHSRPRVLHAADTTGRAIVSILTARVLERPNIKVIPQALALSLILDAQGRCQGLRVIYQQRVYCLQAKAVILATGGGGQVYAQTTNPDVSTGDGVAIAWRAGAVLRDLEFMQFHPTALCKAGAPHFLISEAVRGEGAHLVDNNGERFAFKYHPDGELAPRDVVSRAIFSHLQETNPDPAHAHVYLDLRPIPEARIRYRFPNIIKVCQQWGIDVFNEPIPVTPAAHYWMGGIATDLNNETSIPGLYAIGETSSTGVHGANRLASNSLLECLVYAAQFAHIDLNNTPEVPKTNPPQPLLIEDDWRELAAQLAAIRQELPTVVWQSAGICRSQESLDRAIKKVEQLRSQFLNSTFYHYLMPNPDYKPLLLDVQLTDEQLRHSTETLNLLDIAYLILKSASFRTESRGGHYRVDYPTSSSFWQKHTLIRHHSWSS